MTEGDDHSTDATTEAATQARLDRLAARLERSIDSESRWAGLLARRDGCRGAVEVVREDPAAAVPLVEPLLTTLEAELDRSTDARAVELYSGGLSADVRTQAAEALATVAGPRVFDRSDLDAAHRDRLRAAFECLAVSGSPAPARWAGIKGLAALCRPRPAWVTDGIAVGTVATAVEPLLDGERSTERRRAATRLLATIAAHAPDDLPASTRLRAAVRSHLGDDDARTRAYAGVVADALGVAPGSDDASSPPPLDLAHDVRVRRGGDRLVAAHALGEVATLVPSKRAWTGPSALVEACRVATGADRRVVTRGHGVLVAARDAPDEGDRRVESLVDPGPTPFRDDREATLAALGVAVAFDDADRPFVPTALVEAVRTESGRDRKLLARALGTLVSASGRPEGSPGHLAEHVRTTDGWTREGWAGALGTVAAFTPEIDCLPADAIEAVRHGKTSDRQEAARILGLIVAFRNEETDDLPSALTEIATRTGGIDRRVAGRAVGELVRKNPRLVGAEVRPLAAVVEDREGVDRREGTRALGLAVAHETATSSVQDPIEALVRAVERTSGVDRKWATATLGEVAVLVPDRVGPVPDDLVDRVRAAPEGERWLAAGALGLVVASLSPDEEPRYRPLVDRVRSESGSDRLAAARALGELVVAAGSVQDPFRALAGAAGAATGRPRQRLTRALGELHAVTVDATADPIDAAASTVRTASGRERLLAARSLGLLLAFTTDRPRLLPSVVDARSLYNEARTLDGDEWDAAATTGGVLAAFDPEDALTAATSETFAPTATARHRTRAARLSRELATRCPLDPDTFVTATARGLPDATPESIVDRVLASPDPVRRRLLEGLAACVDRVGRVPVTIHHDLVAFLGAETACSRETRLAAVAVLTDADPPAVEPPIATR